MDDAKAIVANIAHFDHDMQRMMLPLLPESIGDLRGL